MKQELILFSEEHLPDDTVIPQYFNQTHNVEVSAELFCALVQNEVFLGGLNFLERFLLAALPAFKVVKQCVGQVIGELLLVDY